MDTRVVTITNPKLVMQAKHKQAYLQACDVANRADRLKVEGAKRELVDLARLHLKRAQKYHFNSIALRLAGFLQSYFHNMAHDARRGNIFRDIRKKYQDLYFLEEEIDTIYLELSFQINSKRSPSKSIIERLNHICEEYRNYIHSDSIPIRVRVVILHISRAFINHDYDQAIELCNNVIAWLEEEGFAYFSGFYSYLALAYIVKGRYSDGLCSIENAINACPVGTNNWSVFQVNKFILYAHSGDFESAKETFFVAAEKMPDNAALKEQWLIIKGYMRFLSSCEVIDGVGRLRLGKFFNEIPIFSADKEGNNINIIILFILLNLKKGKGDIIEKAEAIGKYISRHLNYNARARIFLKMLLKIPQYDFKRRAVEFRTQKELSLLHKNPIQVVGMNEVEIIPYEALWGLILDNLKN
ncbi:MAG: hypothetical protein AAFZ63_25215 [Bacteroidota bacterium]